ncbi:MAG TPA: hypothetical protein VGD73_29750 [Pseudonocardia sp.]|uniref:hypothetical protein n=1 Tax=Pseudonocardia sp. TaxID=60912 RepID=UPI002EDB426E
MTLDGVAQSGGQPDEDRDGGFSHGGWHAPFRDREAGRVMFEGAESMDALLLGRRTHDVFAGFWPTAPEEMPFDRPEPRIRSSQPCSLTKVAPVIRVRS